MQYICKKGSNIYLIDTDIQEALSFSMFGDFQGKITLSSAWGASARETSILSILSSTKSTTEVYLNDKVLRVDKPYIKVYSDLAQGLKYTIDSTPLSIHRVFKGGKVVQLLLAIQKNQEDYISEKLSGAWISCN